MARILVSIISGADLVELAGLPYIAPYVEVEYGSSKRTTNTANAETDVNPEWNEQFAFDLIEGEDEISFTVLNAGDFFIGKAIMSIAKFGTLADLCFELADNNNKVAGNLIVKVEPEEEAPAPAPVAAPPVATSSPVDPAPEPEPEQPEQPEEAEAPPAPVNPNAVKVRFAVTDAEVQGVKGLSAVVSIGGISKVTDIEGNDEVTFNVAPEDEVTLMLQTSNSVVGTAFLKGETVLARRGTQFVVAVGVANGANVGKMTVLCTTPPIYNPPVSGTLDKDGQESTALTIEVISAEGLAKKCNPCMYVSINDNDKATTHKTNTDAPVWNEKFEFFAVEADTLSATIFDEEEFIAEAIVPVAELFYVASINQQLEVKLLDRRRKAAGMLVLGASVSNNSKPPVPPVSAISASRITSLPPVTSTIYPPSYVAPGSYRRSVVAGDYDYIEYPGALTTPRPAPYIAGTTYRAPRTVPPAYDAYGPAYDSYDTYDSYDSYEPRVVGAPSYEPRVVGTSSYEPRVVGTSSYEPRVVGTSSYEPRVVGAPYYGSTGDTSATRYNGKPPVASYFAGRIKASEVGNYSAGVRAGPASSRVISGAQPSSRVVYEGDYIDYPGTKKAPYPSSGYEGEYIDYPGTKKAPYPGSGYMGAGYATSAYSAPSHPPTGVFTGPAKPKSNNRGKTALA